MILMLYHSIQYERQWWSIRNWTMYRLDTSNNLTTSGLFKNFRNIQADHKKVKLFWLQRAVGFENRIISDGIMTSSLREFTLLRYYVITVADLGVCRVCGRTGPPHFLAHKLSSIISFLLVLIRTYFLLSTQNRLVSLSRMSIESDVMRSIDFSEIINDFSRRKTRRVHL